MKNHLIGIVICLLTAFYSCAQEGYSFSNVSVIADTRIDSLTAENIPVWDLQIDSLSANDFHYSFFITDTVQTLLDFFDVDLTFTDSCSCVVGDKLLFTLPTLSPGNYYLVVTAQYYSDMYAGDRRYLITY